MKQNLVSAVLVDIDGTILVKSDDAFFADDNFEIVPVDSVCDLVMSLSGVYEIVFFTARQEKFRSMSVDHITVCLPNLSDYQLVMRPDGDKRKSSDYKLDTYMDELRLLYDVKLFIDDDHENIDAMREAGVLSLQC